MRVVMVSNFLNHHQLPICQEFIAQTNNNFVFIATEKTPEERIRLGYSNLNDSQSFVVRTFDPDCDELEVKKIIDEADIVIYGSAPYDLVRSRINKGKLTYKYSERLFKGGYKSLLSPRAWYYQLKHNSVGKHHKHYLLCSSAFSSMDYSLFFSFINKSYRWGYFPPAIKYNIDELIAQKSMNRLTIIWVARLLNWKHPEYPLKLAQKLRDEHIDAKVQIIGDGAMRENVYSFIKSNKLNEYIDFKGAVPAEKVRKKMEQSSIFIFTSDYQEGWGAVLNEAMNSGCAVVVSSAIGSVPYLIKNEDNGLVYKNGDFEDFYEKVKCLIFDKIKREQMGKNAYRTIIGEWNAETAVKRLLEMSSFLISEGIFSRYSDGPCSQATRLKNRWFK